MTATHAARPAVHDEAEFLLLAYGDRFPQERARFGLLRHQLDAGEDLSVRSNSTGHLTSSAAVLNPEGTKILLIDHVFLKRCLTPGGHYEPPLTLLASALREVVEETGVTDVKPHRWTVIHRVPLDIDSHEIPANPRKGEGPHVHHDFLFLAVAGEGAPPVAQLAEVHSAAWYPVGTIAKSDDARARRVHAKLIQCGAIPP